MKAQLVTVDDFHGNVYNFIIFTRFYMHHEQGLCAIMGISKSVSANLGNLV